MGFNMVTPVARRFSQPPKVGGQQRFDFFAQNPRQHRRFSAGRDSHQQRRAIDNGWKDKRAQRLIIHDVDQPIARVSRDINALVQLVIFRGGNHQEYVVKLLLFEYGCPPLNFLALDLFGKFRHQRFGDNLHLRFSAQQKRNLTRGYLAAADHQHGSVFHFGKYRQVFHCATTLLQSAIERL